MLQLKGMPRAAQYFPERAEFEGDAGIELNIVQCASCGLVQLNREPVSYYREVITAASFSEKTRQARLRVMTEFVDRFGLDGKTVLEVGSGAGSMLDVLEEAGMLPTGVEASAKSTDLGRSEGRRMVTGFIGEMDRIDGAPFDAFISLNYLEHLPNPGSIISKLHQHTSPSAAGYVTVPNLEYLLKTHCLYEFVADHLSYFTSKTLTSAFESNGFDVLDCEIINEENDIAATVKKRELRDISSHMAAVDAVVRELQQAVGTYTSLGKKVAVWGAGHRTLALLALADMRDIQYVVDSAKFKQGRYTPVLHLSIVAPETLREDEVDLVVIMVPGLYPGEVYKALQQMNLGVDVAVLKDNKIEFLERA